MCRKRISEPTDPFLDDRFVPPPLVDDDVVVVAVVVAAGAAAVARGTVVDVVVVAGASLLGPTKALTASVTSAAVVEAGEWCRCHGTLGEVGGVREREESTAPDVWLPRTEPSKSANGGGGDLFIFLWSSGSWGSEFGCSSSHGLKLPTTITLVVASYGTPVT